MIDSRTDVQVLRATKTGVDDYNQPVVSWAVSSDLGVCVVAQTATTETPQVGRDQTVSDINVYARYTADVTASDRLLIDGSTFEVVGVPTRYGSPGWNAGALIFARLVAG